MRADCGVDVAKAGDQRGLSALGQALLLLNDRWNLLILQRAFLLRIRTFAGWRDELGISESVLSSRLKELVRNGILTTAAYRNGRTRFEYRLTERGLELWIILVAISIWERDWADRTGLGPLPVLHHRICGEPTHPYLACGTCHQAVVADRVRIDRGPFASFAALGARRHHRRTVPTEIRTDLLAYCPDSMEIIGNRWSTTTLAAAFLGVCRFTDFLGELGIAPTVLADRLHRFCELGVFESVDDAGSGRAVYRLTERGTAFFDVFALLVDWAQRWLPAPEGSGLEIVHKDCGTVLAPVLQCSVCAVPIERQEVHFIIDQEI
ncbi:winged helix-turn-helix transcriptional regulator [Rhizohabitans arisaemae]|uniref:winged helix-turn-helix transcriptional regulator n=1 Tax=Rhizohabitans arisaemae TaxID=2720610 RepID=UPI0024B1ACA4|nr:helix-turn-helix domain-containing protein [Rhizohabitans arisaemae]